MAREAKVTIKVTDIPKVEAVLKAWNDPGPRPDYHALMKRRVRIEWPALAVALDKLSQV